MQPESEETRQRNLRREQIEGAGDDNDEDLNLGGGMAIQVALLRKDISYMKKQLADIKYQVGDHYVTKDEFEPVRKLVYGMVALVLITVMGLLLSLVVHK